MPLDPEVRYARVKDFETKVSSLEFPPEVWSAFSMLEQPSNAREVAAALLRPLASVQQDLETLLQAGVIQAKAIGWNQFAPRAKSAAPAAVRADGDAIVAIRITAAAPRSPAVVSLSIASPSLAAARAASRDAAARPAGWKLRPALDAISASVGGGVPGQLLVYKVFLQVPPELLKAAGIESVTSVDQEFRVSDPALRDAFIASARAHASVDISAFFQS